NIRIVSGIALLRTDTHGCRVYETAGTADRPSYGDQPGVLRNVASRYRGHFDHARHRRTDGGVAGGWRAISVGHQGLGSLARADLLPDRPWPRSGGVPGRRSV